MDYDWCKNPDKGIIKPDLTLFLNISPSDSSKRKDFGKERYEKINFQEKVSTFFKKLFNDFSKDKNDDVITVECDETSSVSEIQTKIISIISKKFPNFSTDSQIEKINW